MTLSRRTLLRLLMGGITGTVGLSGRASAQDRFNQDALLAFDGVGIASLVHVGDLLGQMMPHYNRPAEVNIGVGDTADKVPHLTGEAFRVQYGLGGRTPMHYAHTHEEFIDMAKAYGQIGGLDRVATVLRAIRADRPDAVFLTGVSNERFGPPEAGPRVTNVLNALRPEKMDRDAKIIVRGGLKIALIRTPAAQAHLPWQIEDARAQGADVVVCLSQLGLAMDQDLARDVLGIDVILSSASAAALPDPIRVGSTHIIASGTQGRFVSRVDLGLLDGKVEKTHKLIPMFSDLIQPDPQSAADIKLARTPFVADLEKVVGQAAALLYRNGGLSSTWDDLVCAALQVQGQADVALSPGMAWGNTILPGQNITREDLLSLCGSANPATYQTEMTGSALKNLLEAEAHSSFQPDLGQRANHEMIRVGGLSFRLKINAQQGQRVSELTLMESQTAVEPTQTYRVAGWGAGIANPTGPPIWQFLEEFITKHSPVGRFPSTSVQLERTK